MPGQPPRPFRNRALVQRKLHPKSQTVYGAPAIAQRNGAFSTNDATATTITAAFSAVSNSPANNPGNLIVATVGFLDSAGTTTCAIPTDTAGNTYFAAGGKRNNPTQTYSTYIFYAWNIAASASTNTVTFALSATSTFRRAAVHEYIASNGLTWTSDPLDKTAGATGNSVNLSSGAQTTTTDGQLVVGWGAAGSGTITAGAGFSLRQPPAGGSSAGMVDQIQATAASIAALATTSVSSQWVMGMATFKDATPAAVPATLTPAALVVATAIRQRPNPPIVLASRAAPAAVADAVPPPVVLTAPPGRIPGYVAVTATRAGDQPPAPRALVITPTVARPAQPPLVLRSAAEPVVVVDDTPPRALVVAATRPPVTLPALTLSSRADPQPDTAPRPVVVTGPPVRPGGYALTTRTQPADEPPPPRAFILTLPVTRTVALPVITRSTADPVVVADAVPPQALVLAPVTRPTTFAPVISTPRAEPTVVVDETRPAAYVITTPTPRAVQPPLVTRAMPADEPAPPRALVVTGAPQPPTTRPTLVVSRSWVTEPGPRPPLVVSQARLLSAPAVLLVTRAIDAQVPQPPARPLIVTIGALRPPVTPALVLRTSVLTSLVTTPGSASLTTADALSAPTSLAAGLSPATVAGLAQPTTVAGSMSGLSAAPTLSPVAVSGSFGGSSTSSSAAASSSSGAASGSSSSGTATATTADVTSSTTTVDAASDTDTDGGGL